MEKNLNTNRSSVKQIQSSIFFSNLRKEMDKMAFIFKKDDLIKSAQQYVKDGMTIEETQELLKLDGFDPILVEAYVQNLTEEDFAEENIPQWGFDIEDSHGRIYSSSELNIVIGANNREEAWDKAEEEIEKFSTSNLDRIIDVYKV